MKDGLTNEQISKSKNLWDKYYSTSTFPENHFDILTREEKLEILNRDYPENNEKRGGTKCIS